MKQILPYLIATVIVYFCFAFIFWQCNPQKWEEYTRFAFIMLWISSLPLTLVITNLIKLDK